MTDTALPSFLARFTLLLGEWHRLYEMHKADYASLEAAGKGDTDAGQVAWAYMNTYCGCIEQLEKLLETPL